MNEREVSELRRRFRPDKSSISHVLGCYVNEQGEIVARFDQSLGLRSQEETEKFLTLLKRTLSGGLGKNLLDIPFTTRQVAEGEEHRQLMTLRDSALKDEEAVEAFFQKVIRSVQIEGNYLILLAHDRYDVPYRASDGARQNDASDQVYSYILCSVCPVKPTKPALGYYVAENEFRTRTADWLVAPPELGFLFPAFDDRSANLYNALYYTRNTAENHPEFVEAVFQTQAPMAADTQKETFQALLADSLGEECDYDVVQAVHDQLCDLVDEHKHSREDEPLTLSKEVFKGMLECCGVTQERVEQFDRTFDDQFGADAGLNPQNLLQRQMDIRMPDVTIRISPERSDLVETRVVDGTRYLMIRVDEGVEVNGVNISIT